MSDTPTPYTTPATPAGRVTETEARALCREIADVTGRILSVSCAAKILEDFLAARLRSPNRESQP